MVAELEFKGVGLISLTDAINTTSAQGRLVFNLLASLAEFEQELIWERTYASLAAAWARAPSLVVGGGSHKKPSARPSLPRPYTKSSNWASTRLPSAYAFPRLRFTNTCATAVSSLTATKKSLPAS
ncbi:recombinase family protein [Hymenobacter cellulosilyticus]|uniref:Recombinase family protein n=1 Tax=Hymenobacter cellulosilyticus TaxID=2932248 RepID=A0A8T9QDB9_9BACT|nr:recombinase family protein [Hymenobacter cellulosilyticus]UOQ74118.1 recombinase family protein [Hymenobacter cellulosilyticus]